MPSVKDGVPASRGYIPHDGHGLEVAPVRVVNQGNGDVAHVVQVPVEAGVE